MATITKIQGTDSLSASRLTLNDNFEALNNDLLDINALLDWDNSALSGMSSIATAAIDVTNAAVFNSTLNRLIADTDVEGMINLKKGASYDSDTVVNMPGAPNSYDVPVYFMQGASVTLQSAFDGQEITIVGANAAGVNVLTNNVAGVNQLDLPEHATVTLRFYGADWYVIAASPLAVIL